MALLTSSTIKDFDEKVTKNSKVTLVDFWADWCPPCKAMAPILDKIAKDMDKDVDIVKVDIEETSDNSKLAGQNGVSSIPNMVIFKDGKEVDRVIGLTSEADMTARLKRFIK